MIFKYLMKLIRSNKNESNSRVYIFNFLFKKFDQINLIINYHLEGQSLNWDFKKRIH